jgi:hypothetical protein
MPYVIGVPCVEVKDRACVDERIDEGTPMLYPHPGECVPPQES